MDQPSWPLLLRHHLRKYGLKQVQSAIYDSHNVRTYMSILQQLTPATPFRKRHANARHVLLLRLQLAPLSTMLSDDQAAPCTRCHLSQPDTITHWLTSCPALNSHRASLDHQLGNWSAALDATLNVAHNALIFNRWNALPLDQQIQSLLGEIPPLLSNIFKTPPLPAQASTTNRPQPLLAHRALRKLVNIMEAYCKHTFEAIRNSTYC